MQQILGTVTFTISHHFTYSAMPMFAYSKIDFADFIPTNKSDDTIILNLENSHNIYHTFPKIDRCCKINGKLIEYDGIDNMERIKCDMPQNEFTEKYVNKR